MMNSGACSFQHNDSSVTCPVHIPVSFLSIIHSKYRENGNQIMLTTLN